jgi:hypothetical protein
LACWVTLEDIGRSLVQLGLFQKKMAYFGGFLSFLPKKDDFIVFFAYFEEKR